LEDGIATLEQFDAWRASHPSTTLSNWRPHSEKASTT
jgi:hypothetical protein